MSSSQLRASVLWAPAFMETIMYQGDNLAKHMYHLLLKCAIGGWNYDPLRVVFVATFIAAVVTGLPGWPSGSSRWRFLILLLVIGSDADALNKKARPALRG